MAVDADTQLCERRLAIVRERVYFDRATLAQQPLGEVDGGPRASPQAMRGNVVNSERRRPLRRSDAPASGGSPRASSIVPSTP
jgi:hypothetical protein